MSLEIHLSTMRRLLDAAGLDEKGAGGKINITGQDPVVPGHHRYGGAAAAALAAHGVGVATLWQMRGGRPQDISVDVRRAGVVGLRTSFHVERDGQPTRCGPQAMAGAPRFFPTRDGKLLYILLDKRHFDLVLRVCNFLKCAPNRVALSEAIATWNANEIEDALAAENTIAVWARTRDEWLAHPQGQWLAARSPVEVEKIGESAPQPLPPGARPLSGVRVLDMAHVIAGPIAGRMLAEQGADVLHISDLHHDDPFDIIVDSGIGKRNAHLDLDLPDDKKKLLELAAGADVFLQSWRPRSLEKRGFGPEALARQRPGMIYVSFSAYGQDGPWTERRGYEPVGQAASGLTIAQGSPSEPKFAATGTMNDYLMPYLASAGIYGALVRRAREGGSYHVKVSLTRTSMYLMELGELAANERRDLPLEKPHPSDMMEMDSVFGRLLQPRPITEFSDTRAYWASPPTPLGSARAEWLPRA